MPATKKVKLQDKQVDATKQVHTLWPVKFCPNASANLISPTCKLSQGNKISSDHQNNIVVNTPTGDIIQDCQIKTHHAGVDFLQDSNDERAVSATALPKRKSTIFMSS